MGSALYKIELAIRNLRCHPVGVRGFDQIPGSGNQKDRGCDLMETVSGEGWGVCQQGV